ncbi:methylenetetrahydrofolate reductase C-terminal domain-containing protein [uncultured Sneathiella sp.]|uniref:methylenetetrahydrofolate reductase C-terminal domain-containing protein n=1 Tax=uncultured Sneathiella sp. TaxID=879315 RepID=UPI0030EEE0FF|tara:strand:+ start:57410 stop:57946 length:537 start_codon:yes stop_codon:yes gene_type:complete
MAKSAYQASDTNPITRTSAFYTVRQWSVRHSRGLERIYQMLAAVFLKLHPVWKAIGYRRVEKPVVVVEKTVKSFLFDCRMCGQCVLSDTGMSCPMNCPKSLRNGPCGGVRANGNCEVEPDMPCVWVQAWKGSRNMQAGDNILQVQPPVDHSWRGSSAWLRATAKSAEEQAALKEGAGL